MRYEELTIEGAMPCWRHSSPAFIDKLFVLDGCQDGPAHYPEREARNMIPSLIMCRRRGWTRYPRQESIRALLPMLLPMSTQRWKIC